MSPDPSIVARALALIAHWRRLRLLHRRDDPLHRLELADAHRRAMLAYQLDSATAKRWVFIRELVQVGILSDSRATPSPSSTSSGSPSPSSPAPATASPDPFNQPQHQEDPR